MPHFARIDSSNIVVEVIVIDEKDCMLDGIESEQAGIEFCNSLIPGNWIQTSYNSNIRKNYAGTGYTYVQDADAFVPPRPFESWLLNGETYQWFPPIERPVGGMWFWNEESIAWEEHNTDSGVR